MIRENMESPVLSLFEKDREEALRIIDKGESIVKFLTRKTELCPFIGTLIQEGKMLGKGEQGAAFQITFPGGEKGRYVVKVTRARMTRSATGIMTYKMVATEFGMSPKILIAFNGVKATPSDLIDKKGVIVPLFLLECNLRHASPGPLYDVAARASSLRRMDDNRRIELDSNTSLCEGTATEFAISVLTGSLYRKGMSINFLDIFDVATCKKDSKFGKDYPMYQEDDPVSGKYVYEYTFMQMIDKVLQSYIKEQLPDPAEMEGLFIQIWHAILTYQKMYEIAHNDLHGNNVFLEEITGDTVWQGQKLSEVDYFVYDVGDKRVYLPRKQVKYVVKIGDWGLACKYSSPMILNYDVMEDGFYQGDIDAALMPNFYAPVYDPYHITHFVLKMYQGYVKPENLLTRMMCSMSGLPLHTTGPMLTTHYTEGGGSIANRYGRPEITLLTEEPYENFSLSKALGSRKIMGEYLTEPPSPYTSMVLGKI